ncbi:hypothetical protein [Streptomyces albireticuli]|uniref:Lipoprotein n=1 Tax=Streptomyces albireticuli TaxID=1940 RepID=A0A2A2CZA2_9ACTN|nr:hypothetical protein [Streptomyces albireticuli]MCD9195262.1 hypothetical protein [Streptomyces albireticuli]PAU45548.1 hypothetical protein CK936_28970 [Streptomyces albireticuli]
MRKLRVIAAAAALTATAGLGLAAPAVAEPAADPVPTELTWVGRDPSAAVPDGKTAMYDIDVTTARITFTGYKDRQEATPEPADSADLLTTKVRTPPASNDCTLFARIPLKFYGFYGAGQAYSDEGWPHRNKIDSGKWTCRATYYEQRTNYGPFSTPKLSPHTEAKFRSGTARVEIVRIW